jgi:hypothetical protein
MMNKLLHYQEQQQQQEGHLHHLYDRKRTYTDDATIADETDVTTMQV